MPSGQKVLPVDIFQKLAWNANFSVLDNFQHILKCCFLFIFQSSDLPSNKMFLR